MGFTINVNGRARSAEAAGDTPLLYVLRNDFGLNGAKYGCGVGQCGACTVMIDGKATAYVCVDRTCRLPTTEPAELAKLI